ncbi:hypothetical protein MVEN_00662400 [Mycena venus]|uniref:Uncharacterized protein n=1 Tax=Mycena venus TaxID=2733690 RepID=A0A8H7D6E0_9AGAR|nr:hypothetical protein MVEN_00662400 [Mycena venus]
MNGVLLVIRSVSLVVSPSQWHLRHTRVSCRTIPKNQFRLESGSCIHGSPDSPSVNFDSVLMDWHIYLFWSAEISSFTPVKGVKII